MKVTFYSTFLTMHQVPFCDAMYRILGDDFRYVACEATYTERLRLGYPDLNKQYPYVLRPYESEAQQKLAMELSINSDVVVIGSASERYCRSRLLKKKQTYVQICRASVQAVGEHKELEVSCMQ